MSVIGSEGLSLDAASSAWSEWMQRPLRGDAAMETAGWAPSFDAPAAAMPDNLESKYPFGNMFSASDAAAWGATMAKVAKNPVGKFALHLPEATLLIGGAAAVSTLVSKWWQGAELSPVGATDTTAETPTLPQGLGTDGFINLFRRADSEVRNRSIGIAIPTSIAKGNEKENSCIEKISAAHVSGWSTNIKSYTIDQVKFSDSSPLKVTEHNHFGGNRFPDYYIYTSSLHGENNKALSIYVPTDHGGHPTEEIDNRLLGAANNAIASVPFLEGKGLPVPDLPQRSIIYDTQSDVCYPGLEISNPKGIGFVTSMSRINSSTVFSNGRISEHNLADSFATIANNEYLTGDGGPGNFDFLVDREGGISMYPTPIYEENPYKINSLKIKAFHNRLLVDCPSCMEGFWPKQFNKDF